MFLKLMEKREWMQCLSLLENIKCKGCAISDDCNPDGDPLCDKILMWCSTLRNKHLEKFGH